MRSGSGVSRRRVNASIASRQVTCIVGLTKPGHIGEGRRAGGNGHGLHSRRLAERLRVNWARQGVSLADAFAEAVGEGLAAVDLEPEDIDTGHVGNFAGELFAGQGCWAASSARCIRPWTACRPRATRPPAPRAAWRSWRPPPRSRPAATTWPAWSASSRCAMSPARPPPSTWARPPSSGTSSRTPASCGRAPSPTWPTSTTAATA